MKTKTKEKLRNTQKGISLITLVITIVVIIILAAAVILSLNNNNPVGNASKAVREQDRANVQDKVNTVLASIAGKYLCNVKVTPGEINEGIEYTLENPQNANGVTGGTIGWNETKANETTKDNSFTLEIERPTYGKDTANWYIDEQGRVTLTVGDETYGDDITETPEDEELGEGTRVRAESAWNKPYVPTNFHYVEGTVNAGYVIADESGNEFVWIPVDGLNVKYEKWCEPEYSLSYTECSDVPDEEYPEGITSATESDVVNNAGGFYIGRYEAGVPEGQTTIDGTSSSTSNTSGMPVSKKGATVWTYIDYTNANNNAKAYMNNSEVASGLMTGKSWDSVCKWLENNGININDSSTYGNYNDSQSPANVDGYGKKQVTGYSENWKVKNIYDLAGNTDEWTNEVYSSGRVVRGGSYNLIGSGPPVSYRYDSDVSSTVSFGSFRLQLYIK